MSLNRGDKIGPYVVDCEVGRGGMGVVYRATDDRLDRVVAIKALPDDVARDQDRMERFEREAKTLAALNHPNIAHLYGLEEDGHDRFLILEYVEGETLQERLHRGPMSVEESIEIMATIAAGLEAAHDAGVIHRDLKPGNIKLTPDGKVKILDFGLARSEDTGSDTNVMSESPTLSIPVSPTMPGAILGTAPYMSPEQARGKHIDKRTDIWSFGVVLHECLTGAGLFHGESATDSIAAILERETSLEALPARTPRRVRELIVRCLKKDRSRRLRDIGDARLELEQALTEREWSQTGVDSQAGPARGRSILIVAALLLVFGLIGAGAGYYATQRNNDATQPFAQLHFDLPLRLAGDDEVRIVPERFDLSPDGSAIVVEPVGGGPLVIRELNSFNARTLAGTEDAYSPQFSADGRSISYYYRGRIYRVSRDGGPPRSLFGGASLRGWEAEGQDGSIYFTNEAGTSIIRHRPGDWTPETIFTIADVPGTYGFESLRTVRGQDYVLVDAYYENAIDAYRIIAVSLVDGTHWTVIENAANPIVTQSGVLFFTRDATLFSAPFDLSTGRVTGNSSIAIESVRASEWGSGAYLDISWNGTCAFLPGTRTGKDRRIVRVTREGEVEPLSPIDIIDDSALRISPDGGQIVINTLRRGQETHVFDLDRSIMRRIPNSGESYGYVWDATSTRFACTTFDPSIGYETSQIAVHDLQAGAPVRVLRSGADYWPFDWTPDNSSLLIGEFRSESASRMTRVVRIPIESPDDAEVLFESSHALDSLKLSPDGKWMAYLSYATDNPELILEPYPPTGRRWQVSPGDRAVWEGPFWAPDSSALHWVADETMFVTPIDESPGGPTVGASRPLFRTPWPHAESRWDSWDIGPDGHFYAVEPAAWEQEEAVIQMIVNFDKQPGATP